VRPVGLLFAALLAAAPAWPPPPRGGVASERLRADELAVMERLVAIYGETDWAAVRWQLASKPTDPVNPNLAVIPISLANVRFERWRELREALLLDRVLDDLQWAVESHPQWGQRWVSAPVVSYLSITLWRVIQEDLPAPRRARAQALWAAALALTKAEAEARLEGEVPHRPLDSWKTGDTKAEENAWEAALLAAAANFSPASPHASRWDQAARRFAWHAVTRPSDPADAFGVKTTTVSEDFSLANHNVFPNPAYTAATLHLLLQGALTYRLAGHEPPPEFHHNLDGLYAAYRSYVRDDLTWSVKADPDGDATLFPFAFDAVFEAEAARRKALRKDLWRPSLPASPSAPVAKMGLSDDLFTAILNAKVVMYYMTGSYLWHFPPGWTARKPGT
jgi:hypothetical protein